MHGSSGYQATYNQWSKNPPAGPRAPLDPETLARRAVTKLGIKTPTLGTAPRAHGAGIVGIPAWVWIENPSSAKVGPRSTSATDRGLTVHLSAKVTSLTFDMGERGTKDGVRCQAPGVKFQPRYAKDPPPGACTHTYTVSGRYEVTATAHWQVTWSGDGQTGAIDVPMSDTATVIIGESQVVNRKPNKQPSF